MNRRARGQAEETDTDAARPVLRMHAVVSASWALMTLATSLVGGGLDRFYAVGCSLLFAAGIGFFLLGFWNGVQRSRLETVTLPGLLAVSTAHVSRALRRSVWSVTIAQVVVAVIAGSVRPFTEQAFALLVPMLGIGVAALVGSRAAVFHSR